MSFILKLLWMQLLFLSRVVRVLFTGLCCLLFLGGYATMRMPGSSYSEPLPELNIGQQSLRSQLQFDVEVLASRIGERNLRKWDNYVDARDYLEYMLGEAGYDVLRHPIAVNNKVCYNLEVELGGLERAGEIVVVAANYDSPRNSYGANCSASGAAALLSLARQLGGKQVSRTLRFVFLANEAGEELPEEKSGSRAYAAYCAGREDNIVAMFTLGSLGYYSEQDGSQAYPLPLQFFYPASGNFVAFSGNTASANLVQESIGTFRRIAHFPSEGFTFPDSAHGFGTEVPRAFWENGYPAVLISDTGALRYPFAGSEKDHIGQLNYEHLARVVDGFSGVLVDMVKVKKHWFEFFK